MSGIDVGGDSSVEWRVFVENVRRSTIKNCSVGDTGFEQSGVDETEDKENFTVGVKIPRTGAEEFARSLQAAAEEAYKFAGDPKHVVSFALPIEPKNPNQIQIRWKSAPAPASSRALAQPAKGSASKVVKRKAAPKKKAR
jgi:hypothetical protein